MSPRRPSLLRSTLTFSGGTFVSRVLGLVREQAIAYAFGANAATDAFWVAFRIPNFLRRLFAEGSFSVAFVPVFTEVKETRSHEDLKQLVARTAGTLGGVLLVVTAIGVVGAGWVARGFAPGSIDEPVKLGLTTDLLRVTFPFLLFVSLTALAGGVLNSFHKFELPALTPVILNFCMIAGALWLAPHLDTPIMALGWAILAAGILQLLVQLPALKSLDLLSLPRWGWNHPDVRRIMRLMVPTLFGSSVAQINLLLDTLIASFLISGSQTWLAQTDRLLEFPLGVFGVALGTVILPSLSRHHVSTDRESFAKALDWGIRTALLISVPAMLALVLLAKPILATLLQHGRFTAHDVDMAALSLSALSFGLPAFALVKVVAPAFYARQDTKTPVRAGIVAIAEIADVAIVERLAELPQQRQHLAQRRQHAECEHVDFQKTQCFEIVLVPLDDRALRHSRVLDRHQLVQRAVGNHEAADMLRQVARKAAVTREHLRQLQPQRDARRLRIDADAAQALGHLPGVVPPGQRLGDAIDDLVDLEQLS